MQRTFLRRLQRDGPMLSVRPWEMNTVRSLRARGLIRSKSAQRDGSRHPGLWFLTALGSLWFASVWIFTLRPPWELGADLFMRQLLDGDPASNTLSWRWVAGMHTRGKHYLARRDNT